MGLLSDEIVGPGMKLNSQFDLVLILTMYGNILPLRTRMFMASYLIGTGEYFLAYYYIQSVWIRIVKSERY
jgi:hypothetical protein